MSIIDKVMNPTWHAINVLPERKKLEIARIVVLVGAWRTLIRKFLVNNVLDEIRSIYGRASVSEADCLTSHASLAILRCSGPSLGFSEHDFKIITPVFLKLMVEQLLSSELENADKRDIAPYSTDSEIAKIQFFSSCAKILGIGNINFSQKMASGPAGEQWRNTVDGVSGIATGMQRSSLKPDFSAAILAKAKLLCNEFSTNGQSVIVTFAQKVESLSK